MLVRLGSLPLSRRKRISHERQVLDRKCSIMYQRKFDTPTATQTLPNAAHGYLKMPQPEAVKKAHPIPPSSVSAQFSCHPIINSYR